METKPNLAEIRKRQICELADIIKSKTPCAVNVPVREEANGEIAYNAPYAIETDENGHLVITDIESDYIFDEFDAGCDLLFILANELLKN